MNCEIIDLIESKLTLNQSIATKINCEDDGIVISKKYQINSKFGKGFILNFKFEEVQITISRYKLKKDLILNYCCNKDYVQLSFLIEGEKIISLQGGNKDILFESHESYVANINNFQGCVRISGSKTFKEINVQFSKTFLVNHGFSKDFKFKSISDKNLNLPITNNIFTVLTSLEAINLNGISRKILMEAKILELLSLQIENYKQKSH